MKLLKLFLYYSLSLPPTKIESLFNTIMGKDSPICIDVGWWSGFNKGGNIIYNVVISLHVIVEVIGNNNQVSPSHGAPIVSSIVVVSGGRIS